MTAHYLPGDDRDEHQAALYGVPEIDDRPDPRDYLGLADGPTDAVYSATDDVALGMRWGKVPTCGDCGDELPDPWDALCGECKDDRLAEEAHDHSRPGEWHR